MIHNNHATDPVQTHLDFAFGYVDDESVNQSDNFALTMMLRPYSVAGACCHGSRFLIARSEK